MAKPVHDITLACARKEQHHLLTIAVKSDQCTFVRISFIIKIIRPLVEGNRCLVGKRDLQTLREYTPTEKHPIVVLISHIGSSKMIRKNKSCLGNLRRTN